MTHQCPEGSEATMLSLLIGTMDLGLTVTSYGGATLLRESGIRPSGQISEAGRFATLWEVHAVTALLPLLALALIPCTIPDASQKEVLIPPQSDPVAGSPWKQMIGAIQRRATPGAGP